MSDRLRFEILTQIGHGQFSNVYKARWINAPAECPMDQQMSNVIDDHTDLMHHYSPVAQQPHQLKQQSPMEQNQLPFEFDVRDVFDSSNQNSMMSQQLMQPSTNFIQNIHPTNDENAPTNKTTDSTNSSSASATDRYVALKRIKFYDIQNSKMRMDCIQEVKLLQQLKHPNIINYNISFIMRNELFIVLELANGGDLSKLITYFQRRKQLLSERTILKYYTQVCSAVKYIHSKRILHRDIKPANIFMTSNGCVKLGDFGLGRFFSQNTRDAHSYVGTFYYMSPERICESGYGFSSDIWSLGCVLYELITLNSPFSMLNLTQPGLIRNNPMGQQMQHQQNPYNLEWLIDRIVRAEYPSLAPYTEISLRLRQLTMECLNPNPEARPDMEYICAVVGEAYRIQQLSPVQATTTTRTAPALACRP